MIYICVVPRVSTYVQTRNLFHAMLCGAYRRRAIARPAVISRYRDNVREVAQATLFTREIFLAVAATEARLAETAAADACPAIAAWRGDGTTSGYTRTSWIGPWCRYTGPHLCVRGPSRFGSSPGSGRNSGRYCRASIVDADETGSSSRSA